MAEKVVVKGLADLDAMIAEKLMGWTLAKGRNFYDRRVGATVTNKRGTLSGVALTEVPCYSTEIAAAWKVVARMRGEDKRFVLDAWGTTETRDGEMTPWIASFGGYTMGGDSAPMAISLAALRAEGVEVELRLEGEDG